jgi:hypothetical protein
MITYGNTKFIELSFMQKLEKYSAQKRQSYISDNVLTTNSVTGQNLYQQDCDANPRPLN